MINRAIDWGRNAVDNILPEGKFKEVLRKVLYGYYNYLDALSRMITEIEMLEDGSLLVELSDGVKFYAQRDKVMNDRMLKFSNRIRCRYGNCHVLAKIEAIEYFATLWLGLRQQYIDDIYQKYYKVKKGDIIVDLGAHIGVFAVKAAKAAVNEGMVVAIEPDIDNLRFLKKNIHANDLRNVVVVEKGVWSTKDRLKISIRCRTGTHSFLHRKDDNRFVEVEVDTLDNILRELGVKKVDFIKMDIEGAEIEAYKGMKETLNVNDAKLAIAAYHTVKGKQTYTTIAPWLGRDGFEVYVKKGIVHGMKKPKAKYRDG